MKKKFFDVGTFMYLRNRRNGLETAAIVGIAAAVTATTASVGSAVAQSDAASMANATNKELAKESMAQQEKLFREGNIFNASQAEISRKFNSSEAEKARIFEADMMDEQMNKAISWFEKYSSPSSQVQQYLDAGLSPASLAGKTSGYTPSFSLPSASPASSTPVSSASVPQVPQAHVVPEFADFSGAVQNGLNAVKDVFNINKTGKETEGIVTDNDIKKASRDLDLDIKSVTASKIRADINRINVDIDKTKEDINKIQATIKNFDYINKNLDADTQNKQLDYFFHSQEYQKLLDKMSQDYKISRQIADAQIKFYASEVFKNQGSAIAAYAQAGYYKALSKLTDYEKNQMKAYTSYYEQLTGIARTQNYFDTLFGYNERKQRFDIGSQVYEKSRYENSTFFRLINCGRSITDSFGNAVIGVYGTKGIVGGLR